MEPFLPLCECGGRYSSDGSPKCPHCNQSLSAQKAADYIEKNAHGTIKG